MKKFLKVLSIVCLVLLVGGLIALGVCYYVMPIKTTLAFDKLVEILNTKVVIIGGTTLTVGIILGIVTKIIVSMVKSNIKDDLSEIKSYHDKKLIEVKEIVEKAEKQREEVNVLLYSYSTQIDTLEEKLIKVCETIPNAKVQALVSEIKEETSKIKVELTDTLTEVDSDYYAYKTRLAQLEEKIDKLFERLD